MATPNLFPLTHDTLNKCTGCIAWLSNYATSVETLHTVNESTASERNNVEVEGLFRTPPDASSFAAFKQGLAAVDATTDHRGVKSFLARNARAFDDKTAADCVASLLKLLLRDLEVSLVPFDYALRPAPHYIAKHYYECSVQEREENAVQATQELVLAMCQHLDSYPADVVAGSVRVVGQLLALLCTVSRIASIRMPADNLFVPFLPSLCGSRDPFKILEEHGRISEFKDSPEIAHLERLIEYGHRVWGCVKGSIGQLQEALATMMAPATATRPRAHTDRKRDMFKRIFGISVRRNSAHNNPPTGTGAGISLDQFGGNSSAVEGDVDNATAATQEGSVGVPFGERIMNRSNSEEEPTWLAAHPKPVQQQQQHHGRVSLAFLFPTRAPTPVMSSADRVRALSPALRQRLLQRAMSRAGIDEDSLEATRLAGLSDSSGAFAPALASTPARMFAASSVSDTDVDVGVPVALARNSSDLNDFEAAFARGSRLSSELQPPLFNDDVDVAANTLLAIESLLADPSSLGGEEVKREEPKKKKKRKKKKKKSNETTKKKKEIDTVTDDQDNQVDHPADSQQDVKSNTNNSQHIKPPRRRSSHKHTHPRRKSHTKRHGSSSSRKLTGEDEEEEEKEARQSTTVPSGQEGVIADEEKKSLHMFVASDGTTHGDMVSGDVAPSSRTQSELRRKKSGKGSKKKTRNGTSSGNQSESKTRVARVGSSEQSGVATSGRMVRTGSNPERRGSGRRKSNSEHDVVKVKLGESGKRRHRHKQQVRDHGLGEDREEGEGERGEQGKEVSSRPVLKAQGSLKRRGKKMIDLPGDEDLKRLSEQGRSLLQRATST